MFFDKTIHKYLGFLVGGVVAWKESTLGQMLTLHKASNMVP